MRMRNAELGVRNAELGVRNGGSGVQAEVEAEHEFFYQGV